MGQYLPASTALVRLTTLTPSSDASTMSPASVELDAACRLESCSRLCSHRCMGRMSIETMISRACGPQDGTVGRYCERLSRWLRR